MTWKCENWKWPLVCSNLNISTSTWPKIKIKDSFEIVRTSRFQNWPYYLNLVKIWWRYWPKYKLGSFFLWTPCIYRNWISINGIKRKCSEGYSKFSLGPKLLIGGGYGQTDCIYRCLEHQNSPKWEIHQQQHQQEFHEWLKNLRNADFVV